MISGRLEAFAQDEGRDVNSSKQAKLAKEIDEDIESGIELVRILACRKKVFILYSILSKLACIPQSWYLQYQLCQIPIRGGEFRYGFQGKISEA